MPPAVLKTMEEKEKTPAPHSAGTYAPTVEPTAKNIQMRVFVDIKDFDYNGNMIQIFGNIIKRANVKIGWIDGAHIRDYAGKDIGYFNDHEIWNNSGKKIAFIEGEYVYLMGGTDKIRIEENLKEVSGGTISDACRAAIRLLLG